MRLRVWDAGRNAVRDITLKNDARISVNSSLAWSADDTRIILALRSRARDDEARKRFKAITDGPVIVHASKDPFLEWDDLGRTSRWRSLAEVELGDRRATRRPAGAEDLDLHRRARRLVHHVPGGRDREDRLRRDRRHGQRAAHGVDGRGEPVTIAEAKDLKGLTLRWSDDGRTFAYAKKGEVFVQGIDEKQPRSLTPPPKKEGEKPGAEPGEGRRA